MLLMYQTFQEQMRVGFMTYDSKINFYNIKGALTQPQQMTVGDVNDMFVPLVDGFMCKVDESETVIDSLMEQIPQMFADTRETETVLGPVIQAGKEAFKVSRLNTDRNAFLYMNFSVGCQLCGQVDSLPSQFASG